MGATCCCSTNGSTSSSNNSSEETKRSELSRIETRRDEEKRFETKRMGGEVNGNFGVDSRELLESYNKQLPFTSLLFPFHSILSSSYHLLMQKASPLVQCAIEFVCVLESPSFQPLLSIFSTHSNLPSLLASQLA